MNLTSQLKMFAMTCLIAGNLAACVNDTTPANTTATTTTITGQAIAGAVDGTVTVRTTDANGTEVATGTVTNGSFSLVIDNAQLSKALDFEVTGSYRDEVSGATVSLTATNPLALRTAGSHFTAGQAGNAPVTPDTTIIREMVQSQAKTLTQAQTAFQNAFGYTPDLTAKPFDPYTVPTNTPATADNTAAFRAGMFSQMGADLGLTATDLAELPAKFAADLADGTFDGAVNANPVAFGSGVNLQTVHQAQPLGNRIGMALAKFAGSAANRAGVTPPNMGRPPIIAYTPGTQKVITLADGTTQIGVTIDTYAQLPFKSGFRDVKTTHKVTIVYVAGGTGAVNINTDAKVNGLSFKPWMYMFANGMQHGSEMGTVDASQAASGIYYVDVYYRMPTGMMMGSTTVPMGQWSLVATLDEVAGGTASTTFFPNVIMNSMNGNTDLLFGTVSNPSLTWSRMGSTVPREFRVYLNDAKPTGGGHDVTVFVSTQTMAMMKPSFPAVKTGLTNPAITSVAVDLYTDTGAGSAFVAAMTEGVTVDTYGQFTATGVTLSTASANSLQIHLTVDGYTMLDKAGAPVQLSFTARP